MNIRSHARWHGTLARSALIALVGFVGGCSSGASTEDAPPPRTEVRDSAGVRLVQAGFAGDTLRASERLTLLDTLLDGNTPEGEAVVGLVAVQPLADSSLVLFSASAPALLRYPPGEGVVPDTLGRARADSGRYTPRITLLPYVADTLLLWDANESRLTRVTAAGLGESVVLEVARDQVATVSGALRDGSVIAVLGERPGAENAGLTRMPLTMLRVDVAARMADTLLALRGQERTVQLGRAGAGADNTPVRSGSVPFGRTTLWTVGTSSVLTLDTEGCRVERHTGAGRLTLRLNFRCVIEAVTPEDREQFLGQVLATAQSRADSSIRTRFVEEASFPPSKSTATGLLTDPWDRIWVRLPVASPTEPWTWWVFGSDGMPLVRLGLDQQWRIAAVRERDLIAVQTDRIDAPPVVVRMALPDALHPMP